ncbi:MAG: hypothetical protein F6J87_14395 [Spirulina sp. SIO3F2]|nr:hypothetical protein [Spirulina sp. SIO3F2]
MIPSTIANPNINLAARYFSEDFDVDFAFFDDRDRRYGIVSASNRMTWWVGDRCLRHAE